jgi:hypothetical protein
MEDRIVIDFDYWFNLVENIISTVVFVVLGLIFFALSDWFIEKVLPRSIVKGIEEDKNVALAIVVAAVIIGVALIVAAAIH